MPRRRGHPRESSTRQLPCPRGDGLPAAQPVFRWSIFEQNVAFAAAASSRAKRPRRAAELEPLVVDAPQAARRPVRRRSPTDLSTVLRCALSGGQPSTRLCIARRRIAPAPRGPADGRAVQRRCLEPGSRPGTIEKLIRRSWPAATPSTVAVVPSSTHTTLAQGAPRRRQGSRFHVPRRPRLSTASTSQVFRRTARDTQPPRLRGAGHSDEASADPAGARMRPATA